MLKKVNLKLFFTQIGIAMLLLIVIELGFRWLAPQINKTIFVNKIPVAKIDTGLGYVLNPGSVLRHKFTEFDVTYTINEQGFNQPNEVANDTALPTILFLGDSYTFGMGTPYSESYVGLLSKKISPHCQTINAGVLGYQPTQELELLRRLRQFKPDVVCLEIVSNDFLQLAGASFDAAANLADTVIVWNDHQRWHLHAVDFSKRMVLQSDHLYFAMAKKQNEALAKTIVSTSDTMARVVSEISKVCKSMGAELIVFFYPSKYMITQYQYENQLDSALGVMDEKLKASLSTQNQMYFNPTLAIAKDYMVNKQDHHYRMDGHCTAHGNAFLASLIQPKIEQALRKRINAIPKT